MSDSKNIYAKLAEIQQNLKVPKNQYNSFGKYKYRSCEDIVEAVKPLLNGYALLLSDETSMIGETPIINATATLTDGAKTISVTAQAGIALTKKGMDISQSFGSSSSYARKYALSGLFGIDDTKDADADKKKPDPIQKKDTKPTSGDKPKNQPARPASQNGNEKQKKYIASVEKYFNWFKSQKLTEIFNETVKLHAPGQKASKITDPKTQQKIIKKLHEEYQDITGTEDK